jgi:cadmium resistance protein CadD (predicted permease)
MDVAKFLVGIVCLILGFIVLFFVPKKMHSTNQLEYGSYMMRWAMPFILIPLGIGLIIYSI